MQTHLKHLSRTLTITFSALAVLIVSAVCIAAIVYDRTRRKMRADLPGMQEEIEMESQVR